MLLRDVSGEGYLHQEARHVGEGETTKGASTDDELAVDNNTGIPLCR